MRHHEDTIAAFAAQVINQPGILALIVVGSVARGTERATSDVDVYLVVTDDAFAAAQSARRIAYIDTEAATYDSYLDIKLASPRYLERAVAHADDPTRASFLDARIIFDHTRSIAAAVARIVTLPDDVWQRRVHAYHSLALKCFRL
ncbi:MAG TPA: nucleotidyltransferase domain-containing protein [Jiangellaceae bacterium]